MDDDIRKLILRAVDQTISPDDFERLQTAIEHDDDVRSEYLRTVNLGETLAEIASSTELQAQAFGLEDATLKAEPSFADGNGERQLNPAPQSSQGNASRWDLRTPQVVIAAAAIIALVGGGAFWVGQQAKPPHVTQTTPVNDAEPQETLIAGHATLRRSVDLRWSANQTSYYEGDVLPNGALHFASGVAEIDFFCGATLIVEGPAKLDVESDWSVRVVEGRLRANVPPAARGFVVKAAESEIIDLGTEFAVEVGAGTARVEVIDGEVELRGGDFDGDHLTTGQRQWLKGSGNGRTALNQLSTIDDVVRRREVAQAQRFAEWKTHSQQLRTDSRLIAYYPIADSQDQRLIPNAAATGSGRDGSIVGPVNRTVGRFGEASSGLAFDRPGARVRTRIEGEFQSFTFTCWVRIDSLKHRYNALFMADGYENGEPHWQIRDDGRLMFSVMVDDTPGSGSGPMADSRLHRIYYTDPIWDASMSGQWFHLAAVYDPVVRKVTQYVNGAEFSNEGITDRFHVTGLKIGTAEIGNWGQPLRPSPWFSVRNLDGAIDELAVFNSALKSHEISDLYEKGKPVGY